MKRKINNKRKGEIMDVIVLTEDDRNILRESFEARGFTVDFDDENSMMVVSIKGTTTKLPYRSLKDTLGGGQKRG